MKPEDMNLHIYLNSCVCMCFCVEKFESTSFVERLCKYIRKVRKREICNVKVFEVYKVELFLNPKKLQSIYKKMLKKR